jgi:thiol-disulfide isomerase/thioredoxin
MPYLTVGLALLTVVSLFHLLVTFGLIRRLRSAPTPPPTPTEPPGPVMPAAGERPGDFAATTLDGEGISAAALSGITLVGFFTATCPACRDRIPEFEEYATAVLADRDRVLAVVVGEGTDADALAQSLNSYARVVHEPEPGELFKAFGIRGFPSVGLLENGVMVVSGFDFAEFPRPSVLVS